MLLGMTRTPARTGILILRIWIEVRASDGLRIRVTETLDAGGLERSVATVCNADEACGAVRTWIDAFVQQN